MPYQGSDLIMLLSSQAQVNGNDSISPDEKVSVFLGHA